MMLAHRPQATARARRLRIQLEDTKYPICAPPLPGPATWKRPPRAEGRGAVSVAQQKLDWREVGSDEDWDLAWLDSSVSVTRVMRLSTGQVSAALHMQLVRARPAAALAQAGPAQLMPHRLRRG